LNPDCAAASRALRVSQNAAQKAVSGAVKGFCRDFFVFRCICPLLCLFHTIPAEREQSNAKNVLIGLFSVNSVEFLLILTFYDYFCGQNLSEEAVTRSSEN
jgi:hypothetical protein